MRTLFVCSTVCSVLFSAQMARADAFVPSECIASRYSIKSGVLGRLAKSPLRYTVHTCSIGSRYEVLMRIKVGAQTHDVITGISDVSARGYLVSYDKKRAQVRASFGCAARGDDPKQVCHALFTWQAKTSSFKKEKVVIFSPRAQKIKKIKSFLAKKQFKRAHTLLSSMPADVTGHQDEGRTLLMMFVRGVHNHALGLFHAGKVKQAASLSRWVFERPPIMETNKSKKQHMLCFDEVKVCRRYVSLRATHREDVLMFAELANISQKAGHLPQASLILEQLVVIAPQMAPLWRMVGDVRLALGLKRHSAMAYAHYKRLAATKKTPRR